MKKKWSSDKVKEVQRWIIKRWPDSFTQGPDLRPLSLQVHKDLLKYRDENPLLSGRVLREVLKRHTTSYGYLYGLSKHDKRYDLDGKPVGDVSPEHREWARNTLKLKQKEAQRIRKEARKQGKLSSAPGKASTSQRSVTHGSATHGSATQGDARILSKTTDSRSASPVIKYKQTRRKLIKPAAGRTVDLAS